MSAASRATAILLGGLLLLAAASGVGGYVVVRAAQADARIGGLEESLRVSAAQIALRADEEKTSAPSPGGTRAGSEESQLGDDVARWARAALSRPGTVAAGLLDVHRELLQAWPDSPEVGRLFASARMPAATATALTTALPEGITAPLGLRAALTVVPLERGPLRGSWGYLAVVSLSPPTDGWIAPARLLPGALAIVWVLTGAVMLRAFRRSIFGPLRQLADVHAPPSFRGRLLQRQDDLGTIARQVAALEAERDEARTKAGFLASTLEHRVARQSEQFSRQLRRAEHAAEIDSLTGLANRRFIDNRLEPLVAAQREENADLAVVLFDVDHFKALNDTAGHAAGDDLLRFIGDLLHSTLREDDVAVRLGGDEFAIVVANQPTAQVVQMAERLVKMFGQNPSIARLPVDVTLSAGVAGLRETAATDAAALLQRADEALYAAKKSGKNAVSAVPPETVKQPAAGAVVHNRGARQA